MGLPKPRNVPQHGEPCCQVLSWEVGQPHWELEFLPPLQAKQHQCDSNTPQHCLGFVCVASAALSRLQTTTSTSKTSPEDILYSRRVKLRSAKANALGQEAKSSSSCRLGYAGTAKGRRSSPGCSSKQVNKR